MEKMEKVPPYKVLLMTIFGDLPEARINDQHKVASRYLNSREAERTVFYEQVGELSADIKEELESSRDEYDGQETPESVIARDADILECLIQAKEFVDRGFKAAEKFFQKAPEHLRTKSAKALWAHMQAWDSNEWWERLSRFER